jgi:hypothetical protein
VRVVRERDHDALDCEPVDELGQVLRPAEDRQVSEVLALLAGSGVEEAEQVHAVLRVLEELPPEELSHRSGADDDRVLRKVAVPAELPADDGADRRQQQGQQHPERGELAKVRDAGGREPGGEREEPDADRRRP